WARYMKTVHEELPPREFDRPAGIVENTVTAESGKLPTEDYRGETVEELFIAGSSTIPTEFDETEDFHDERRERLAFQRTRPTSTRPTAARDIFARDLLDTSDRDDDEVAFPFGGSDTNPFFDDPRANAPGSAEDDDNGANRRSDGSSDPFDVAPLGDDGAQDDGAQDDGTPVDEAPAPDEPADEPAEEPADEPADDETPNASPEGEDATDPAPSGTESSEETSDEQTEATGEDEEPDGNPMLD
ncbi:MAG: hypothetical protein ACOC6J_08380, partial [Spirochaetota bacterium]